MFRAVETKKRTYLAVLCGDEGERVELFTVSKSYVFFFRSTMTDCFIFVGIEKY